MFREGVFIVTYRKEKERIFYLVLHRKLHWKGWEFPKGGIEKGETKARAVRREILEEVECRPENIIKFNVFGKYKYGKKVSDREGFTGQTYSLFAVEVKEKKIKIDTLEHKGYKWLKFEKAQKLLTWHNQKECLGIVNRFLKNENKLKNPSGF